MFGPAAGINSVVPPVGPMVTQPRPMAASTSAPSSSAVVVGEYTPSGTHRYNQPVGTKPLAATPGCCTGLLHQAIGDGNCNSVGSAIMQLLDGEIQSQF